MERPEAPLLLDAADLRELVAEGVLEEANAAALIDECLLEPFARMGADDAFIRDGRKPSGDARRIVSERGFSRADDVLGPVDDDPFLYEIEPLQDWVLARNLISVAARLAGIQRLADDLEPGRGTLERAGFREVAGTSLVSRLEGAPTAAWVIPILHGLKTGEDGSCAPSLLANPLLGQMTETGALELGDVTISTLKGAPEVAFPSVWDVDGGAVEPGGGSVALSRACGQ